METRRYTAYNSTRGTFLNSKLAIANRELEPLKFLELLIGGLGLDSESGLWLKPLAGAPQVPRVFPFDLVYLDRNERVIESAEIFPSSDIPPYSDEAASAMVLPLHAASLSRTLPGDLLTIQDAEVNGEVREQPAEAAEPVPEVKASEPEVAAEVAAAPLEVVAPHETTEVTPPATDECLSARAPAEEEKTKVDAEPPAASPATAEDKLAVVAGTPEPVLAIVEYKPEIEGELPAVPAACAPNLEVPVEGFWAPVAQGEEPSAKKSKSAPEQGGEVSAEADKPEPQMAMPFSTDVAEKADSVEKENEKREASRTTVSTSRPVIQSVGFTISQYRNWQVNTTTPQASALESPKSPDKRPVAKEAVDSKESVAQPEGSEKLAEKTTRGPDGGQSSRSSHVKWSALTSRAIGKPGKPGGASRRASAARRNLLLNREKAASTSEEPKAALGSGEAKAPTQMKNLAEAPAAPAAHEQAAKLREPSLPLWKISPSSPNAEIAAKASSKAQDASEGTKQSADVVAPASEVDSGDLDKPSKLPVVKVSKKPGRPLVVEAVPESPSRASRVPEAISKLMNALHRIGGGTEQQSAAKQEISAIDRQSSWLIPEALHRDRRRAVRRAVPGLVAYYFTGGAPQPYKVSDISASGFFLVTRDQWMPETMILMTLQKPSTEGKQRRDSITVLCKVVRRGEEGIGAEFVMPETLDPNSRDIKPSRATDRMALAKFLFSGEEGDDCFEVLGFALLPGEVQAGESIEPQEDRSPD